MISGKKLSKKGYFAEEVLAKSQLKEIERMSLYQSITLAFLPFNIGISRLMKELEKESDARINRLEEIAMSLQLSEAIAPFTRKTIPEKPYDRRHFFVIHTTMAMDILEQVWQHEYRAQCFYEWLKAGNATAGLDKLLADFIRQAKNQAHILQDAKAEVFLQGQWRRDQGMLKRIS